MYCRVLARVRWSSRLAEARRERFGETVRAGVVVEIVAGSGHVVDDVRCFRDPGRGLAALVNDAGRDLCVCVPGLAGPVS